MIKLEIKKRLNLLNLSYQRIKPYDIFVDYREIISCNKFFDFLKAGMKVCE